MNRGRLTLTATALSLLGAAAWLGRSHTGFATWTHFAMAAAVFVSALLLLTIRQWRDHPPTGRQMAAMILLGLLVRLLLLPAPHELSDDAARYHWDGKVASHGLNPYTYPPSAPQLAHLRTGDLDQRLNHPDTRTVYPPAAQAVFALGYRLTPASLRGLQSLGLLAEMLTWWILARELARRRRSLAWLLLAVWSPLLIFQGYLPGHVDVFTMPFIALLLAATMARHARRAGLYLALACLFKPLALLLMPAMARELGRRRTTAMIATSALVVGAAYLPFLSAGHHLFSSFLLMASDWSFNGSGGALLEGVAPQTTAHMLASGATGLGVLWATWRGRDFLARAVGAQLAFVVFTPTLFPWYLMGTVPLLVLRAEPALLALVAVIPLADNVVIGHQLSGVWHEAAWVRAVEYSLFYGVWAGRQLWRKGARHG